MSVTDPGATCTKADHSGSAQMTLTCSVTTAGACDNTTITYGAGGPTIDLGTAYKIGGFTTGGTSQNGYIMAASGTGSAKFACTNGCPAGGGGGGGTWIATWESVS